MNIVHDIRVLVMEADDAVASAVCRSIAERRGIRVKRVANLKTAVETLESEHIDVVLAGTDLAGADILDGIETLAVAAGTTPVVALTERYSDRVAQAAIGRGAHECIPRSPLEGPVLARIVAFVAERRRMLDLTDKLLHRRGAVEGVLSAAPHAAIDRTTYVEERTRFLGAADPNGPGVDMDRRAIVRKRLLH